MKKSLWIFVCALGLYSHAQQQNSSVNSNDPAKEIALVKVSGGIEISYSTTTDDAGNKMLNVHFKNVSEERKSVNWAISGKYGASLDSKKMIELKPGKEVIRENVMEIKGDYSSYPINLTIK